MFENMNSFRQSMQSIFADCPDYICRQMSLCGADAVVLTIRELADKEYIADSVIRPMLEKNDWSGFRGDFCAVLRSSKIAEGGNADDIASALISGSAVVAVMTDRLYIAVISADSYFRQKRVGAVHRCDRKGQQERVCRGHRKKHRHAAQDSPYSEA